MKKQTFISIILFFALLFCMSIPAFADSHDVNGTYVPGINGQDVISFDVSWGAMSFTYTDEIKIWNDDIDDYDIISPASWSAYGNTVTVVNHSNVDVNVSFKFESVSSIDTIIGTTFTYDDGTTVNSAVRLTAGAIDLPSEADMVTATLDLVGSLPSDHTAGAKIGTVTVTVSKAS